MRLRLLIDWVRTAASRLLLIVITNTSPPVKHTPATTANTSQRNRMRGVSRRTEGNGSAGGSPSRKAPSLGVVRIFACAACSAVAIDVAALHAAQRIASSANWLSPCTGLPHFMQVKSSMFALPKSRQQIAHAAREARQHVLAGDRRGLMQHVALVGCVQFSSSVIQSGRALSTRSRTILDRD